MRASRAVVAVAALLLGWSGSAQADTTVLLKGTVRSVRYLRSLSMADNSPSGTEELRLSTLVLVRLRVDRVLAGRWSARNFSLRLQLARPPARGMPFYLALKLNAQGHRQSFAWDFGSRGICMTANQFADYRIDETTLPPEDRCRQ